MFPSILALSSSPTFPLLSRPRLLAVSLRPLSKSHICFAYSPSNQNPVGDEEARWLREEQRWLREEQRWLREESRWNAERQALLQEISSLKLQVQDLPQGSSPTEAVANIAKFLHVLKEVDLGRNVNRITVSGTSAKPLVVEAAQKESDEVVIKEVISIPDKKAILKKRATLRKGSEGDGVREMQEALQKLGFYSGEEDTEFSSFSTGTERAVKTWQATLGEPENGIMTAELLEILFGNSGSRMTKNQEHKASDNPNKSANESVNEYVSQHGVFLLGENRWEDPSRLSSKNSLTTGTGGNSTKTKCVTCRGEGHVLCMECDGTGEPNIEEQFMEWVDEGAKCPYCEGLGYTTCDLCGGTIIGDS